MTFRSGFLSIDFIAEVLKGSPMIEDVQARGVVQGVVPGHEVQYVV